ARCHGRLCLLCTPSLLRFLLDVHSEQASRAAPLFPRQLGVRYRLPGGSDVGVKMLIDELIVDSEMWDVVTLPIGRECGGRRRSLSGVVYDSKRSCDVVASTPGQGHPSRKRTFGHSFLPRFSSVG